MRRSRRLLLPVVALLLAERSAGAECVAMTFDGQPAWQLIRIGSGGAEAQRLLDHCEKTCGGEWVGYRESVHGWCRRTTAAAAASAGASAGTYDPKQLQYVGRAVDQYVQTGNVDSFTGGMAGFEIGVALHESLKRNAAIAAEKKRLEELRKVEEERQRRIREARELEEKWSKLLPQMKLSSDANVAMKLDDTHRELGFKFDGSDPSLSDPSNRELMLKDRSTCFFQDCRDKYEMPGDSWSTPYVDLRHLRRGVAIAKQTRYAPGDQRDWILGQAMNAAQGGATPTDVPADAVVLPPNALTLLQDASIDRKIATDARIAAATEADSAQRGRDMVAAVLADAKKDADPRDAERKKFIAGMETDLKRRDVEIAQRKKELGAAQAAEKASVEREKRLLGGLSTHDATNGRPVGRCEVEQQAVEQWKSGLPTQAKAIAKEEAVLKNARASARAHRGALKEIAVEKAIEKAQSIASNYVVVVHRAHAIEGWRGNADPTRLRNQDIADLITQFEKMHDDLDELKETWEKSRKATTAGAETGKELAERSHSMAEAMALLNEKMNEAGLWSTAGGTLAKSFGPAGEAAFAMAELSIDVSVEVGGVVFDDRDAARAHANLEIMRSQYRRATGLIEEKETRLKELRANGGCL